MGVKSVIGGAAWAASGRMFMAVRGIVMNMLLARLLSPAALGSFFIAQSIVLVGSHVGGLGMPRAVVRFVGAALGSAADSPRRWVAGAFLSALAVTGVVACMIFLALPRLASPLFGSSALGAIAPWVALWLVLFVSEQMIGETFRAFNDIRGATVFGGVVSGMVLLLGLIVFAVFGHGSLPLVVALAIVALVVSDLLALSPLSRTMGPVARVSGDWGIPFKRLVAAGVPLMFTNVALYGLWQSDIWILGVLRGESEVAVYGATSRLVQLVTMPMLVVNFVVPPLMARYYAEGRRGELESLLRITATVAALPSAVALLALALMGGPILEFVYGSFYASGALILSILCVGQFVNVLAGSCGYLLMMTGHERQMLGWTVAAAIVTVALAIHFGQRWGGVGVAIALAVGMLLQNAALTIATVRTVGIRTYVDIRYFTPSRLRQLKVILEQRRD